MSKKSNKKTCHLIRSDLPHQRVSPHMTLRRLREHFGEYLGEDAVVDKFIFLKRIGKKLAVVRTKQETELKLKSFAPPYAFNPELYLLPGVESIYLSSSSTPEKHHDNAEYTQLYTSYHGQESLGAPTPEAGQNPHILGSSLKNHLSQDQAHDNCLRLNDIEKTGVPGLHIRQSSEQRKNEKNQEKYCSQRRKGETSCNTSQRESSISPYTLKNLIPERQNSIKKSRTAKTDQRISLSQAQETHHTTRKREKSKELISSLHVNQNRNQEENNQTELNHIPQKIREESSVRLGENTENGSSVIGTGRHTTGDSGIPESLEDRDLENLRSEKSQQHPGITKSVADTGSMQDNQTDENNPSDFAHPKQYLSPPTPPLLALSVNRFHVPNRVFPTEGSELNRQLHLIKTERKDLEKTRVELIKKVKVLLEQNKLRRYQARDYWKKKYFEVKKVTVSLEGVLNKLREDFELHYQKLLMQLEARDIRKKHNILTSFTHSKNNTIIQITTLQHDIDQLKRKLDNAKVKLVIEIKLRKQATSDLRELKAELAHKKVKSLKLQSERLVSQPTPI
ncbi:spermatogenesis-associated protein 1 isoform X2 [Sceloporus undulatus]|uniref:spermatogenesis-associated protein 1 isoform X2 n=1 Tax=Sceloporus undulatus TaxID=8520 RepID=UPI001C4C85DF|nr:spermatogenesis-associated protein 1 isoform X2 [Sceloporus undulatus]